MTTSPAELRAAGCLLAKMGAHFCRLADAEDRGDREAGIEEAKEILRCMGGYVNLSAAVGALPDEARDYLASGARQIAEEFIERAPPGSAYFGPDMVEALADFEEDLPDVAELLSQQRGLPS